MSSEAVDVVPNITVEHPTQLSIFAHPTHPTLLFIPSFSSPHPMSTMFRTASMLARHATRTRIYLRPLSSKSATTPQTFRTLMRTNIGDIPVGTVMQMAIAFYGVAVGIAGVVMFYIKRPAEQNQVTMGAIQLKNLQDDFKLDDIEEQRKVIYCHMADMSKPSLQFVLKPKVTKAVNKTFIEDITGAMHVSGIPVRILCVPPGYGKSYALSSLLKELKTIGAIAGADIVRGDQSFLDDSVDLDEWLLKRLGVKEKCRENLEAHLLKPKGEACLPYYIIFDQLDKVRLHPAFETFILRLKDIGLRHKNVRFLMSTNDPLVAEQIHRMNGNEKIRFGRFYRLCPLLSFPLAHPLRPLSVRGRGNATQMESRDAPHPP